MAPLALALVASIAIIVAFFAALQMVLNRIEFWAWHDSRLSQVAYEVRSKVYMFHEE